MSVRGSFDLPVDEQTVGDVVPIAGWVLIDGQPAARVEVFVDGQPPVRARRAEPRADLTSLPGYEPGATRAAGFQELVDLGDAAVPGAVVTLAVRAEGRDGRIWAPTPVRVVVRDREEATPLAIPAPLVDPTLRRDRTTARTRPRVGIFTHSLRVGGGELYLQELLTRLVDLDVATFLVVSPEDGALRAELEAMGVTVHIGGHVPVEPLAYAARAAELGTLLVAWGCDVVLANTLGVFGSVDAALAVGLPVIWAIHESFPLDVFSHINWGETFDPSVRTRLDATLEGADVVVFEAEATRALYAGQLPAMRGRHVPYGIDLASIARYEDEHPRDATRSELGFAPSDRVLLVMGVFQDRKAQLALVHAFAPLAASHPHAKLVLVGHHPSPYGEAVRQTADELGLGDSIRIEGIHPDTYRWYRAADVLVSAADIESLPRSILEVMAFGVPVAAASVFGVPEVVHDGDNGWLFEARDGNALTGALRRVLDADDDELAGLSVRARADAQAFDGERYAVAYREMIHELLAQRAGSGGGEP